MYQERNHLREEVCIKNLRIKTRRDRRNKLKELEIFKLLKKEVEHGANGTQDYVIKKGVNKGKVAK
jgi:hypothetical protein